MEDVETPLDGRLNGEVSKADGVFGEIGSSALSSGMEGGWRNDFLRQLDGPKATETFREMEDNDPVAGGMLFACEFLLRQIEWFTAPDDENPDSAANVDFVQSNFSDMSFTWEDTLGAILSFLGQGWSYFEECYKSRRGPAEQDPTRRSKYTDGKIGWRKFAFRPQWTRVRWAYDEQGGIQGMVQRDPKTYDEVTVPIDKALLFRTTSARGGPEGKSILRRAYRPWFFKKNIEEIEAIGIERDLAGLPIMYVPEKLFGPNATPADKTALETIKKQVRNIRMDEQMGMVIPQRFDEKGNPFYKFELATTASRRVQDTDAVIARHDQRIAMACLADFILLGHEAVGSKALSVSKVEVFETALTSFADIISDVFNRFAIPRLLELNGMDPSNSPVLKHGPVERVHFEDLVGMLKTLADAGAPIFPNIALLKYLFGMADLPDDVLEELDALANEAAQVPVGPVLPDPNSPEALAAAGAVLDPTQPPGAPVPPGTGVAGAAGPGQASA